MSLEFDCRWSSTVANKENFKIISNFGFYCRWSSSVFGVLWRNVDFICGFWFFFFFFFFFNQDFM
jgi:hypothetical protein